jgi:hypothetical protein
MNLMELSFPVYYLGINLPQEDASGLVYIETGNKKLILDDPAQPYETLGLRRIALASKGQELYKLNKAIYYIKDLIKLTNRRNSWFIDSQGRFFQYIKSTFVKLACYHISKVMQSDKGGSIILVDGYRYKTLYRVQEEEKWAGILEIDARTKILYGVYTHPFKNSVRKI